MIIIDSLINAFSFFKLPPFKTHIIDRYLLYLIVYIFSMPFYCNLISYIIPIGLYILEGYIPIQILRNKILSKVSSKIFSKVLNHKVKIDIDPAYILDTSIIVQIIIVIILLLCKHNINNFYYSCIKKILYYFTGEHIKTFSDTEARQFIIRTIETKDWNLLYKPQIYQAILNLKSGEKTDYKIIKRISAIYTIISFFNISFLLPFYSRQSGTICILSALYPDQFLALAIISQIGLPYDYVFKKIKSCSNNIIFILSLVKIPFAIPYIIYKKQYKFLLIPLFLLTPNYYYYLLLFYIINYQKNKFVVRIFMKKLIIIDDYPPPPLPPRYIFAKAKMCSIFPSEK